MAKMTQPGMGAQTVAQRCVRGLGAAAVLLLLLAVPLVQVGWWALAGEARGGLRGFGYVPAPEPRIAALLDGSYMLDLERHLQEDSPVVWQLRGAYNEWRFRLGLLQTDKVHVGRDGWMFYRQGMEPTVAVVDGLHGQRVEVFARVKAMLRELGAELFVVVLPDKDRVYPEYAYTDGQLPPSKARLYPLLMQELEAAGVAHLDACAELLQAKAAAADGLLYCRRDSHWTPRGARVVAAALARKLEQGAFAALLGPAREDLGLGEPEVVDLLPDVVGLCGLRSVMRPVPSLSGRFPFPASPLTESLVETKRYHRLRLAAGGVDADAELERLRQVAPVALAGTSFSGENGAAHYAAALRRVVDDRAIAVGAGAVLPMQAVLRRILGQPGSVRLVIWEIVERGVLEGDWTGL